MLSSSDFTFLAVCCYGSKKNPRNFNTLQDENRKVGSSLLNEQLYHVQKSLIFLNFSLAFQEALVFWQFSFSHLSRAMVLWPYSFLWYVLTPFFVLLVIIKFNSLSWTLVGLNMHVFQFVLTATGTEAEQVISTQRRSWSGAELGKLPVFYAVDTLL